MKRVIKIFYNFVEGNVRLKKTKVGIKRKQNFAYISTIFLLAVFNNFCVNVVCIGHLKPRWIAESKQSVDTCAQKEYKNSNAKFVYMSAETSETQ